MMLHELEENEWRLIQDFIPQASSPKELESGAIRASVNAILWRMRTGKPWHLVPRQYGDHTSICRRFTQWRETGVWREVTMALARVRK
jgi:transposase